MSRTIPDSMSDEIQTGTLLGKLNPSKESKGSWGETYLYKGDLYHICYTDTQEAWVAFIVSFESDELEKHVEDYEDAKRIFKSLQH